MKFKLFKWIVEITEEEQDPTTAFLKFLKGELAFMFSSRPTYIRQKVELIKMLRRPEITKRMIAGNLVPMDEVREAETDKPYVSLNFAKEWVEKNCSELLEMEV